MKATKAEIIEAVSRTSQLSRNQIKQTLNLILDNIHSLLVEQGAVELRGFGTFIARVRVARDNARNPHTGGYVSVVEHRVAVFKPGKNMREDIAPIPNTAPPEE